MPRVPAWYVYPLVVHRGGIAAIALNQHGHPESRRDRDGVPLCSKGLRMVPSFQFSHTRGYTRQHFLCPLLFPNPTGEGCEHEQFKKGPGCVKDLNWELGGQMRVTLDRDGPLSHAIYDQRTSTERINSQSKELGIKRPKVRNLDSIRNLNTLTYLVINARALRRARALNASLLRMPIRKVAYASARWLSKQKALSPLPCAGRGSLGCPSAGKGRSAGPWQRPRAVWRRPMASREAGALPTVMQASTVAKAERVTRQILQRRGAFHSQNTSDPPMGEREIHVGGDDRGVVEKKDATSGTLIDLFNAHNKRA